MYIGLCGLPVAVVFPDPVQQQRYKNVEIRYSEFPAFAKIKSKKKPFSHRYNEKAIALQ